MKKGKILTILTSFSLIVSNGSFVNAISAPDVLITPEEKITEELYEVMSSTDESSMIPVGIRIKDLDAFEIDRMVEQRSDFKVCNYADMNIYTERIVPKIVAETEEKYGVEEAHVVPLKDPETNAVTYTADVYYDVTSLSGKIMAMMKYSDRVDYILSSVTDNQKQKLAKENPGFSKVTKAISDDIDEYLAVRRSCVIEAYKDYNYDVVDEYVSEKQVISNVGFAPYLIAEVDKSQISELIKDDFIEYVDYFPNVEAENELDNALNEANVQIVQSSGWGYGYTGTGVKIGVLEAANGKFDSSYCMLNGCQNLNYVYLGSNDYGEENDHATFVTSIIKGKTVQYNGHIYRGVAPDSTVYQSCINDSYALNSNIEFLASYGTSIINCSFGYPGYTNTYSSLDWLVDQAINNLGLVLVKSAGNTGSNVTTPGKAFNAITVGNCNTTTNSPYSMSDDSAYLVASGLTNKPDISAPGTGFYFPEYNNPAAGVSGTSLAAPIVSGIAALMIQCYPTFKLPTQSQNQYGGGTYYNTVKAVLLLCANHQIISNANNNPSMSGSNTDLFREKSGAGLVDARKTIDVILGNGYFRSFKNINMSQNGTSPNGMNTYTSFSQGEQLRSVLCFSKIHNVSTNDNDWDLTLRDSTNTQIVYSNSSVNNAEFIEYQFISDGNYLLSAEVFGTINVNSNETLPGALVYYSVNSN